MNLLFILPFLPCVIKHILGQCGKHSEMIITLTVKMIIKIKIMKSLKSLAQSQKV